MLVQLFDFNRNCVPKLVNTHRELEAPRKGLCTGLDDLWKFIELLLSEVEHSVEKNNDGKLLCTYDMLYQRGGSL